MKLFISVIFTISSICALAQNEKIFNITLPFNIAEKDSATTILFTNPGQIVIGKNIIFNGLYKNRESYNLFVEKGILTEKLRVANSKDYINWADFVFDENYNLMSLHDIETYIKNNKHLPEIPTTTDVKQNGIDVAEMDARLLQKIEELTLYLIQQQKEIEGLKEEIQALKQKQ